MQTLLPQPKKILEKILNRYTLRLDCSSNFQAITLHKNHNNTMRRYTLFEQLNDCHSRVSIQSSGGLVQEQNLGLYDEFHSNVGPLPLPTRHTTDKLSPNLKRRKKPEHAHTGQLRFHRQREWGLSLQSFQDIYCCPSNQTSILSPIISFWRKSFFLTEDSTFFSYAFPLVGTHAFPLPLLVVSKTRTRLGLDWGWTGDHLICWC